MTTHPPYRALHLSTGKMLIAAAWVDGELQEEELTCLKTLILRMPGINFEDWRKLKIYMAYPLSVTEQEAVVLELTDKIYVKSHKTMVFRNLFKVLQSDGNLNIKEKTFVDNLSEALSQNANSFLQKLKYYLLKNQIESQDAWKKSKIGRDKLLHDFFSNPAYFLFRKSLIQQDLYVPHSKPQLQKICLFASILSWFASEDGKISLDEENFILETLTKSCGIEPKIADCIFSVAKAVDISEIELRELCITLSDQTEVSEREKLFTMLTKLVLLDRTLTSRECECLRTVAVFLHIRKGVWEKMMSHVNLITTFS